MQEKRNFPAKGIVRARRALCAKQGGRSCAEGTVACITEREFVRHVAADEAAVRQVEVFMFNS